jgi:hypothetical protein
LEIIMSDENKEEKEILEASEKLSNTDSTRINREELKQQGDSVLKPIKKEETPEGINPLALRDSDTARLKRVKPGQKSGETDTVRLKVIKEKKKQLAGILTASQTIRLRPPSAAEKKTLKLSSDDIAGSSASGTLKVSLPSNSSESGTIKVNKPTSNETLKVVAPTQPSAAVAPESSGTLKLKSSSSPGKTLKVKAASGGTLKLKPAAGGTLKLKAVDGGTVKLQAAAPSTRAPQSASKAEVEELASAGSEPGVFMLITNLLTTAVAGYAIWLCASQFGELVIMK